MQSEVNQEENLNTTDFDEHFAKISSYTYCNSDYLEYTCKYQIISLYGRKLLWQDPREARIRLVL